MKQDPYRTGKHPSHNNRPEWNRLKVLTRRCEVCDAFFETTAADRTGGARVPQQYRCPQRRLRPKEDRCPRPNVLK